MPNDALSDDVNDIGEVALRKVLEAWTSAISAF
jgi:hypothetical protein